MIFLDFTDYRSLFKSVILFSSLFRLFSRPFCPPSTAWCSAPGDRVRGTKFKAARWGWSGGRKVERGGEILVLGTWFKVGKMYGAVNSCI